MYKLGTFCFILGDAMVLLTLAAGLVGMLAGNSLEHAFGNDGTLATIGIVGGGVLIVVGWAMKKAALEEPPAR
jgi:undecaprenyl pyrophosphate phosphatase UppP